MELVPHDIKKEVAKKDLETLGRKLYQTNETSRDLGNVMEHPLMKEFLSKYFLNYDESMLLLMKTYEQIDSELGTELNPFQKLGLLFEVIHDRRTRAIIRDKMIKYTRKWKIIVVGSTWWVEGFSQHALDKTFVAVLAVQVLSSVVGKTVDVVFDAFL